LEYPFHKLRDEEVSEFLSAHPPDLPAILKLAKLGLEDLILFITSDRQAAGELFSFEELIRVACQKF
jgi:hypothetical protein